LFRVTSLKKVEIVMMAVDDSIVDTPSGHLGIRSRMQFTGRLDVQVVNGYKWSLYLYMGRIIWATGGPHLCRRWRRHLAQYCSQVTPDAITLQETDSLHCWDYHTLIGLIKRQQITTDQAIAFVRSTVAEVLFDIIQQENTKQVTFHSDTHDVLEASLSLINAEQVLQHTQQAWNAWCELGLVDYSPDLALVLRHPEQLQQQTSEKVYRTLTAAVDGKRSLRELSAVLKQEPLVLMRLLVPLFRKGLLGWTEVPDLPAPAFTKASRKPSAPSVAKSAAATPKSTAATGPLVACIDDSVRECQAMEQILTQAGYQFTSVQDSIQALPKLLEQQPSLIFLDLVMPVANGYEICAQIRRVSRFKNIPVVILTSNDGIIDRVRAKVVGSTDFLAKPVEAEKVLAIMRKHLPLSVKQ
jgi:two-component system, chemotaxis family, response regulator PixG